VTVPLPTLTDELAPISRALDGLSHDQRIAWMRGLSRKQLMALYELSAAGTALSTAHFYGAGEAIVIHHGQNSLPMFNHFQKRVCQRAGVVQGYNHQTMAWLTGPGHFTMRQDGPNEVIFDYIEHPASAPPEFPALADNMRGFSRFVYGGMIDRVRRVSRHCVIGAAFRAEKDLGARFMLTRENGVEE
jgi:hypothetical protein